jgi:malate dehydrogenase (oxaloacetate-decarboxylating)
MIDYRVTTDPSTGAEVLEVPLTGQTLLDNTVFNKGTAFSPAERREFGLLGLLPPRVDSLDEQVIRMYEQFLHKQSDLERHIFLRHLQDQNETLFYRLLQKNLTTMLPLVYTPTVGAVCQHFSHILREPRGLFISYPERGEIDAILENRPFRQVDVIVVTDGERVLGLGDQGVGGMGIPVGKLSLYTLCGGIDPARTLPIMLDVGTNNQDRLDDPLYAGWRHERIRGPEYDDFIESFVRAVIRKLPHVLLQWEDFAQANAGRLLKRYRDRLCTFNDDIQGTAAVTTGTLLAAVQVAGSTLRDQRVVVLGAGSAGCGISEQLSRAMVQDGLSEAEARARFWLIDKPGLLHDGLTGLQPFQQPFAQPRERLTGWQLSRPDHIGLADVVANVHPTILIGVTGQANAFPETVVRDMALHVERPIIFPLSNPTAHAEATPADLVVWTEGRALIATGSPFADVPYHGSVIRIAQCNNNCIFPAVGLGVLAVGARRVTDEMFMAAARALAECSPALSDPKASLLPPVKDIRTVARHIALAVAAEAQRQGVAEPTTAEEPERLVDARRWEPRYRPMKRAVGGVL